MGYWYILGTLVFTVYGQLILKWRISKLSFQMPDSVFDKILSLIRLIFDPFIFSGFISAFIASLFWMAALTKVEITKGYPFMSLAPVIVFLIGVGFLGETFTWGKIIGLLLVVIGVYITVTF
jgi:drug/metabolite transporter (DMT)-like permease